MARHRERKRWFAFSERDQRDFEDEKIVSCFLATVEYISGGYFGRVDYNFGYRPEAEIWSNTGLSVYRMKRPCLVFAGKEDCLVLVSGRTRDAECAPFELNRAIRPRHIEPPAIVDPQGYRRVQDTLVPWGECFSYAAKAYGLDGVFLTYVDNVEPLERVTSWPGPSWHRGKSTDTGPARTLIRRIRRALCLVGA